MSWNHRVIFDKDTGLYSIHEVYYVDGENIGMTENPVHAQEESVDDLEETLRRMLRACQMPVLESEFADK